MPPDSDHDIRESLPELLAGFCRMREVENDQVKLSIFHSQVTDHIKDVALDRFQGAMTIQLADLRCNPRAVSD